MFYRRTVKKNAGKPFEIHNGRAFRKLNFFLLSSLDLQSKAVNELFDNKLIRAPIELKEGDTVLDSGTGSGIVIPKEKSCPS